MPLDNFLNLKNKNEPLSFLAHFLKNKKIYCFKFNLRNTSGGDITLRHYPF